ISRQASFQKTFMLAQMVGARTISQASTRTRQLTTNVGCGAGAGAFILSLMAWIGISRSVFLGWKLPVVVARSKHDGGSSRGQFFLSMRNEALRWHHSLVALFNSFLSSVMIMNE
uniref:Uncharacterized protein n=1 Tax=Aegilops tauschii subsp. strangulata TaxID=200361 RepID=A0A453H2T3_AEGTS